MDSTNPYESGCRPIDVDQSDDVQKQRDGQFCKAFDQECVNVLLDMSEDHSLIEQEAYESQSLTGWEEVVQGWGRSSPFACLFQAHSKGRKVKSDSTDSHCVLCADLKDTKMFDILVSDHSGTSAELSCETAEEPLENPVSAALEVPKTAPSNASSPFSEEEKSDFNFVHERNITSDSLRDELLFNGERCLNIQPLAHPPQCNMQWSFLKDKGEEKIVFMVLPPVKTSASVKAKSPGLMRRGDPNLHQAEGETRTVAVCDALGPVIFGEKVDVDGEPVSPYPSSTLHACQGSLTSKQRLVQHMVSAKRHQPFSTVAEPLVRATSLLGRNHKQDELTRSPLRHNSGHRFHFGFRSKNLRRPEPELPMLFGTRVPIPVSTQRLL